MADRFPHWCSIGGKVKAKKLERLQKQIASVGWPSMVLNAEEGKLILTDDDGVCDAYEDFLAWLQKNKLPYDYVCSGRYEYNGDMQKWRPGMDHIAVCETEASDQPFLARNSSALMKVLKELDAKRCDRKKMAAFIRHELLMDVPELPKFQVEG